MVLVAIALVVLLGFVALAVDIGFLWGTKRKIQTAADAAAVAGAVAARIGQNATSAADNVASLNGFTNGTNGVTITVTDPYSGCGGAANCIKVEIAKAYATYFLTVVGYSTINIHASAVSGAVNSGNCLFALGSSAGDLTVSGGSGTSVTLNCGILANSSINCNGTGSAHVTATSVGQVGGTADSKCAFNPALTTDTSATSASNLFPSLVSQPSCTNNTSWQAGNGPGCYGGGASISGDAHFGPGVYNFGSGGMKITGSGTVTGSGVSFISTGKIDFGGSAKIQLSAPTSHVYAGTADMYGILFWDTYSGNNTINGSSGSYFDGALYFPTGTLNFSGNSSSGGSGYTIIAASQVNISGSSTLLNNYPGGGSPIQSSALYQ